MARSYSLPGLAVAAGEVVRPGHPGARTLPIRRRVRRVGRDRLVVACDGLLEPALVDQPVARSDLRLRHRQDQRRQHQRQAASEAAGESAREAACGATGRASRGASVGASCTPRHGYFAPRTTRTAWSYATTLKRDR